MLIGRTNLLLRVQRDTVNTAKRTVREKVERECDQGKVISSQGSPASSGVKKGLEDGREFAGQAWISVDGAIVLGNVPAVENRSQQG